MFMFLHTFYQDAIKEMRGWTTVFSESLSLTGLVRIKAHLPLVYPFADDFAIIIEFGCRIFHHSIEGIAVSIKFVLGFNTAQIVCINEI